MVWQPAGFRCLQASHNNSSQHKHSCKNNYVENKEVTEDFCWFTNLTKLSLSITSLK